MAQPHPFFLVLLLYFVGIPCVFAGTAYTSATQTAHHEFLKLKINSGNKLINQELSANPNNAAALLVANYADFLTLCIQQDAEAYDKLLAKQEERLSRLEKLKGKSAWDSYAIAEVKMQIGTCKLLYGNKLYAAWDIRQAYLQYASIAKKHPDFIPNKKTLGMLQVLIGSVPDNYKWFLNIIGMKGNTKQGLANLSIAATKENPFKNEAQVLYAILLHLTDQTHEEQSLQLIQRITKSQHDNLLYRFVAMHLLKKTKHNDAALRHFQARPTGSQYLAFPYLHHMAADLYLYKGDYEQSAKQNLAFLEMHQGEHYLKAANFKLYLAYYFSDHSPRALWYFKQVSEVGTDEIEEDKAALKFVSETEKPVKQLLLARLRSDGGYYREALAALNTLDTTAAKPATLAEYTYRKARIYHGLKANEQAIKFYKNTLVIPGASDLYFAPHAALQLGYLYLELNQAQTAKVYFKKAMAYDNHEYKNSINAKAKLALSTL